jgi:hypothetical protein
MRYLHATIAAAILLNLKHVHAGIVLFAVDVKYECPSCKAEIVITPMPSKKQCE